MPFDRLSEAEDADDSGMGRTVHAKKFSIYFFLLHEGWRFPLEESDCIQN